MGASGALELERHGGSGAAETKAMTGWSEECRNEDSRVEGGTEKRVSS